MTNEYPPAVARRRKELLGEKSIRQVARDAGIADSQLVRLLNGRARQASYKLVRNVAAALDYKNSDLFYEDLAALWKSIDRAAA